LRHIKDARMVFVVNGGVNTNPSQQNQAYEKQDSPPIELCKYVLAISQFPVSKLVSNIFFSNQGFLNSPSRNFCIIRVAIGAA